MKLYHGSTIQLGYPNVILPAMSTGIQRETWRKNKRDVVFLTTSLPSAEKYARKAVEHFGGQPVVYTIGGCKGLIRARDGEYHAELATVVDIKVMNK